MCSCSCEEIRQIKKLRREVQTLKETIVASAKETVTQLSTQLNKAKDELSQKLEEGTVSAEDLAPLQSVAQALDDLVPDLPAEETPPA